MKPTLTILTALLLVPLARVHAAEIPQTPPMYFGDTTRLGRPFAKDPSVIRFGGRYLLYYSTAPWAKEIAPPDAPRGWAIGIAESRDLLNWKKVGEILPAQECDKNGLCAPGAIVLDGKVHLFYQTYGPPGSWNSSESGHPGVFVDEDRQIYLFFQGNNDKGRTWFLSWVKIACDGDTVKTQPPMRLNAAGSIEPCR